MKMLSPKVLFTAAVAALPLLASAQLT
ncbi:hypothetical protein PMI14_05101, partial [Acidovorax sp. CF316]